MCFSWQAKKISGASNDILDTDNLSVKLMNNLKCLVIGNIRLGLPIG